MTRLVLLAWIAGQRVAFDTAAIEAVVDIADAVPVPFAPARVLGLSAIRSQVMTVIDCADAVGARSPVAGRALVATIDGHRYALRVDTVEDVISAVSNAVLDDAATIGLMSPAWRAIAAGRLDLDDGFAVIVDPARLAGSAPLALAA